MGEKWVTVQEFFAHLPIFVARATYPPHPTPKFSRLCCANPTTHPSQKSGPGPCALHPPSAPWLRQCRVAFWLKWKRVPVIKLDLYITFTLRLRCFKDFACEVMISENTCRIIIIIHIEKFLLIFNFCLIGIQLNV